MNHPTQYLLSGLLALGALGATLHAQTPAAGDPFVKDPVAANVKTNAASQNVMVVLETYALDKNEALAVLESERGSTARYRRVLDLAKSGKARIETLTALAIKNGQRAVAESNDEVRYPTQFSPPAIKTGVAAPTAWETRNAGDVLEFEAVIKPDRRTCTVNLIPQHVTLAGFRDVGGMVDDALISQPILNVQKLTTSVEASDGEVSFLGTHTPPTARGIANGEAPSEVWLSFLHLSLSGPPAEEAKPPAKGGSSATLKLEYTCYSLDRGDAREILIGPTTPNAQQEKIQALLGVRKARLEHVTTLHTLSGQRAVTQEVQEVRFATEYVPESRAASSESTLHMITTRVGEGAKAVETTTRDQASTTRTEANAERKPGYTSAFETRNTGVTIEVEPVLGPDGVTVDLNHAVQSVALRGNLQVTGVATQYPAQLLFESRKLVASHMVSLGRSTLVGTLNPPGADGVNDRTDSGRTWLLFVRALNEP